MGLVGAASASAALEAAGTSSVRIADGGAAASPFLRFSTLQGPDWHARFRITLMWRGVPRATAANPATVYGEWHSATKEVAAASVASSASNGVREWAVPLSAVSTVKGTWSSASDWSFAARLYDELHFRVTVRPLGADGAQSGPDGACEAWVGWMPRYTLTAASYDLDSLDLVLGRSAGWLRADDRWALEAVSFGLRDATPAEGLWGQVGEGRVSVPLSALRRRPSGGSVTLRLRVNAAYKAVGLSICDVEGTFALRDLSKANTPRLSIAGSSVAVADSGDLGVPDVRAEVRLAGSPYTFDNVRVGSVPGEAAFMLPPAGAVFEAAAAGAGGEVSATVELGSGIEVRDVRACDPDAGVEYAGLYNVDFQAAWEQTREVERLGGRLLESVWYGTGGQGSATLSFTLVGEGAAEQAESMCRARRLLVRTPDVRRLYSLGKCTWSSAPGRVEVTMDLTEVAG